MESRFWQYVEREKLIKEGESILVAVSGGADSVALCYLLKATGCDFGIAHCNFKLRAEESDQDAIFVEQLAEQFNVPFYSTSFDTLKIAKEESKSIQVLARDLRYEWLESMSQVHHYNHIATAHHLNDAIETFIYNFAKGTSLRGLRGIPVKNGRIIRPLLFAKREDIISYLNERNIAFREDSSNAEDKYARNKIRHHIIPVLKTLNPSLEETSQNTLRNLKDNYEIYFSGLQQLKEKILEEKNDTIQLRIDALLNSPAVATVLYECISPFGFNSDQCDQLLTCIQQKQTGAQFYSSSHQLLLDRAFILIKTNEEHLDSKEYLIEMDTPNFNFEGNSLKLFQSGLIPESWQVPANTALLDWDKLQFPLRVRHWKKGDSFQPLGMGGKKQKLQDFFSNQKLSRFEKENVWILETAKQEICWIIGYRIDERFKLKTSSENILKLEFQST